VHAVVRTQRHAGNPVPQYLGGRPVAGTWRVVPHLTQFKSVTFLHHIEKLEPVQTTRGVGKGAGLALARRVASTPRGPSP
jgi:hypothetical protein